MGRNKQTSSNLDIEQIMKDLFGEFKKKHKTKEPFLLFDISNAKENDHTRFLKRLLSYRDTHTSRYLFLESFCKTFLDFTFDSSNPFLNPIEVSDQKKAIGVKNSGNGFIDLYIKIGDWDEIVIENKILGASDCENQLHRYIYSINHPTPIKGVSFSVWNKNKVWKDENKFPYVLYLTKNGDKEPSIDSLNRELKGKLEKENKYITINYQDQILPWLEDIVLPICPYGINGTLISGVQQYIKYLRYYLYQSNISSWKTYGEIRQSFEKIDDKSLYQSLTEWIKSRTEKQLDDPDEQSFINQIELFRAQIFEKDMPNDSDWVMHFTPSFIEMSKKSWISHEDRKYHCPSLAFVGSTKKFLNGNDLTWTFRIAHLPANNKEQSTSFQGKIYQKIKDGVNGNTYNICFANHELNADFKDNEDCLSVGARFKADNEENRKTYLHSLIGVFQNARLTKDIDDILKLNP